jgi:putative ABC transport system permease protein
MLKHYLLTAFRHFVRHKVTTVINIGCLAIGLVCFLAAHWAVTLSRSADSYFSNADRIYVLTQKSASGVSMERPITAWIAAEYLKADMPELEAVARATDGIESGEDETPVAAGEAKAFVHIRYADPQYLDVFSLPFVAGDAKNALRPPHSAVLTEKAATQLFGDKGRALGRTLLIRNRYEVVVTGVIGPIKSPSHMEAGAQYQFDVLASMDVYEARAEDDDRRKAALREWSFTDVLTFVVLPKNGAVTAQSLVERLQSFVGRHVPHSSTPLTFSARPIAGLTMDTSLAGEGSGVSIMALLYILGGLVLLIACLNYANLATSQALSRAKEMGMRRAVGASRGQVMAQQFIECGLQSSVALCVAAVVMAVVLAILHTPGTGLILDAMAKSAGFWSFALALYCAVTLTSGAYPALVLSRVQPIHAIRSGVSVNKSHGISAVLVAAQFTSASFLLTALLVMTEQNDALVRSAFDGMNDPIVILRNNVKDAGIDFDVLRSELLRQPHIKSVTGSAIAPWSTGVAGATVSASPDQASRKWFVYNRLVNDDFFATLGLELLAGRTFDRTKGNDDSNTDTRTARNVVIDRVLAEQLGFTKPAQAIGKSFYRTGNDNSAAIPLRIVGVVKTRTLTPAGSTSSLYVLNPQQALIPSIRIAKNDVPAALAEIDSVWARLAPNVPMKRQFGDEVWDGFYDYVRAITKTFAALAALAFVNAALGLLGISIHAISRRTREIGVRKTLGASVARISALLLKSASKPVIIGNLIACPLAFLAMRSYLTLFTYRVSLSLYPFALSLLITVAIAWVAVGGQAFRAARVRPARVLRYE